MIAMGVAGVINMSMLIIAASLFHGSGAGDVDTIEGAHAGLQLDWSARAPRWPSRSRCWPPASRPRASAPTPARSSCRASSTARSRWSLRRLVTMLPALVVLAIGLDPSRALVLSQVVLSFGIPFALVPLVMLTRRRDIMGTLVNRPADDGRSRRS